MNVKQAKQIKRGNLITAILPGNVVTFEIHLIAIHGETARIINTCGDYIECSIDRLRNGWPTSLV